jgi:hypothetical protein
MDLICYDLDVETWKPQFRRVKPKIDAEFAYLTIMIVFNKPAFSCGISSFANLKVW